MFIFQKLGHCLEPIFTEIESLSLGVSSRGPNVKQARQCFQLKSSSGFCLEGHDGGGGGQAYREGNDSALASCCLKLLQGNASDM